MAWGRLKFSDAFRAGRKSVVDSLVEHFSTQEHATVSSTQANHGISWQ
jgi:hypothetical protein